MVAVADIGKPLRVHILAREQEIGAALQVQNGLDKLRDLLFI